MAVHLHMRTLILVPVLILVLTGFLCIPAAATIDLSTSADYDYTGTSPAAGEEIHGTVLIKPGSSEITNLTIQFIDLEGYIDPYSFEKTISPAGSQAQISVQGNILTCNRLGTGEQLTISFNTYPKTIKHSLLNPTSLKISYTQLGQQLSENVPVQVDMSHSAWFSLETVKGNNNSLSMIMFIAALLIAIVIILVLVLKIRTLKEEGDANKITIAHNKFVEDLYTMITSIEEKTTEIIEIQSRIEQERTKKEKSQRTTSPGNTDDSKPDNGVRVKPKIKV